MPDLWDTVEIQSNMVILLTQWPLFIIPKYYFSKFNCTSRPLFTICLVISIIPTCLTMQ